MTTETDWLRTLMDGISAQGQIERAGSGQLSLRETIALLSAHPDDAPAQIEWSGELFGFDGVDSYRGYYSDLALEPVRGATNVRAIRQALESAIGETYQGYKGGDYTMGPTTPLWVANYGTTGAMVTGVIERDGTVILTTAYDD
jgi:hypothetical protein